MPLDLKTLEKLIQIAKKNKLLELEVEDGKQKFKIKTSFGLNKATLPATSVLETTSSLRREEVTTSTTSLIDEERYVKIVSPFVGTFYSAPAPDADPYVTPGHHVQKGEVLCIVEAMKLMNEIESEVSGKIISILVQNGQPVEYGEPLFLIEPA